MRLGRTSAFVLLALLAGGIVSQLPSAMADDTANPFSALWDAIFDLQSRDDALQAQIDELRAERNALLVQAGEPAPASNLYASIDVEAAEDGRTLVHVTAGNSGPDRAAGVKLTTFYLMPLFEINSIDGSLCEDKSRGIIECIVGTLEEDQEYTVTIDATARESGMANTWTVDVSTTTGDSDYSDNHVTYDFETGSGKRIEIPQVEQPAEEEPEQSGSEPTDNTEAEEPQESTGNQTSAEPEESTGNQTSSETVKEDAGSNGTSTETEESDSTGNQTSADSEETVEESSDKETESKSTEQPEETPEEQPAESEEQAEESGDSEESAADESPEEGSESEDAGEESAPEEDTSESEESDESSSESGEENPPQ